MQNNIAYMYDGKTNTYIETTKSELMNTIFDERGNDIRNFIEFNEDKISSNIANRVNNFLDKLDTDQKYSKKKGAEYKVYIYSRTKNYDMKELCSNSDTIQLK